MCGGEGCCVCNCGVIRGSEKTESESQPGCFIAFMWGGFCTKQGGARKRNPLQIKANHALKKHGRKARIENEPM